MDALARESERVALRLHDSEAQVIDTDGHSVNLYFWRDGLVTWTPDRLKT